MNPIPSETQAERNVAALRKRYPEYADVLSVIPEGTRYLFERTEEAVCNGEKIEWTHA